MSPFEVKHLWSSKESITEDFEPNGFCILEQENKGFVLKGSRDGNLSISVHSTSLLGGDVQNIISLSLEKPILQIEVLKHEKEASFLVLHADSMIKYQLNYQDGMYFVEAIDSKDFVTEAYNCMLIRDSVCVQDWGGHIYIYDDKKVQKASLRSCSLPGHMKYLPSADSIILVSDMHILCYDIQDIIFSEKTNESPKSSWNLSFGEDILDLLICDVRETEIYIIGRTRILIISNTGEIKTQMHLKVAPCSAMLYFLKNRQAMLLLHDINGLLTVYEGTKMIWRCKNAFEPISLALIQFRGVKSCIAQMNRHGVVKVSCLGTRMIPRNMERVAPSEKDIEDLLYEDQNIKRILSEGIRPPLEMTLDTETMANEVCGLQNNMIKLTLVNPSDREIAGILVTIVVYPNCTYVASSRVEKLSSGKSTTVTNIVAQLPSPALFTVYVTDQSGSIWGYTSCSFHKKKAEESLASHISTYFTLIDDHLDARIKLRSALKTTDIKTKQFRVVQKRIMIVASGKGSCMDKQALMEIFQKAYRQLCDAVRLVLDSGENLLKIGNCLTQGTLKIHQLIKDKYSLDRKDYLLYQIESILSATVNEFIPHEELGWEEHSLACLNYALNDWSPSLLNPRQVLPATSSLKDSAALKKAIRDYVSNICMTIETRNTIL